MSCTRVLETRDAGIAPPAPAVRAVLRSTKSGDSFRPCSAGIRISIREFNWSCSAATPVSSSLDFIPFFCIGVTTVFTVGRAPGVRTGCSSADSDARTKILRRITSFDDFSSFCFIAPSAADIGASESKYSRGCSAASRSRSRCIPQSLPDIAVARASNTVARRRRK